MKINIQMKAEATTGKGRTFWRVYNGNKYQDHGITLSDGSVFGLRRDSKGRVLELHNRDIAISPMEYDSLMRTSIDYNKL